MAINGWSHLTVRTFASSTRVLQPSGPPRYRAFARSASGASVAECAVNSQQGRRSASATSSAARHKTMNASATAAGIASRPTGWDGFSRSSHALPIQGLGLLDENRCADLRFVSDGVHPHSRTHGACGFTPRSLHAAPEPCPHPPQGIFCHPVQRCWLRRPAAPLAIGRDPLMDHRGMHPIFGRQFRHDPPAL
jgi:hypothetical protein